jgi:hypothetical protein
MFFCKNPSEFGAALKGQSFLFKCVHTEWIYLLSSRHQNAEQLSNLHISTNRKQYPKLLQYMNKRPILGRSKNANKWMKILRYCPISAKFYSIFDATQKVPICSPRPHPFFRRGCEKWTNRRQRSYLCIIDVDRSGCLFMSCHSKRLVVQPPAVGAPVCVVTAESAQRQGALQWVCTLH